MTAAQDHARKHKERREARNEKRDALMHARLVAAAPEILEQLKRAEYAIRHASGETVHPGSGRAFDYEDFQVWAYDWLLEARAAIAKSGTPLA